MHGCRLGLVLFSWLCLEINCSHHHHHKHHHHHGKHKQKQVVLQQQEISHKATSPASLSKETCTLDTDSKCASNYDCEEGSRCSRRTLLNGGAHTHATCVCEVGFCADTSGACKRRKPEGPPTDQSERLLETNSRKTTQLSLLAGKPPRLLDSHNTEASYVAASEIRSTLRKHIAWCIALAFTLFAIVAFLSLRLRTRCKYRSLTTAEQLLVDRPTASLQATSEPARDFRVVRDPETKKFLAQIVVGDEYFKGPGREDYRDADEDLQKFLRSYHMAEEGKERENVRKAVAQLQKGGR